MKILSSKEQVKINGGLEPMGIAVVTLFGFAAFESLPQLAGSALVGMCTGPYIFSEPVFNKNLTLSEATSNTVKNVVNAPLNSLAGGALGLGISILSQFQ